METASNNPPAMKFCPSCGSALSAGARFCPQCGTNIAQFRHRTPISVGAKATIAGTGLALFAALWFSQQALVGTPPSEKFKGEQKTAGREESPAEDAPLAPELVKLKEEAEKNPRDKKGWFNYAQALGERLSMKGAPQNLIFEAIGALRQILDIDPNDKDALLTMAEISFQQQAFAKSAEFYEKYLVLVPEDIDIRARYASSLSFVGKFDQSLAELGKVLSVKPDHFHALAYSAVTYAEMGNKQKAREVGEKALQSAPSDEAKKRFQNFLNSLDRKESAPTESTAAKSAGAQTELEGIPGEVVALVKNNPVAGKKFTGASLSAPDTLRIDLDNFPMSQMPPFVKQKFTGAIREKAFGPASPLKVVILYDSSTQSELERLTSTDRGN